MKKDIFFSFLSGFLLILSFPSFNLEFLAWVGFIPLFFAIRNKSKTKAFLLSYLTGVIFWWGTIYWLVNVTFVGTFVLILYLALYFGLFGLIFRTYDLRSKAFNLILIPCAWVLLEYCRSYLLTGFPWALLGYSQYKNLPVIQIADITGAWGVSFLVMMANVAIYSIVGKIKKNIILPVAVLIIVLGYGYYQLKLSAIEHELSAQRSIKISVIQPNIPQELKWDPRAQNFIMDKYFELTRAVKPDSPDLIIWPEAAVPAVLEEEPVFYQRLRNFTREIGSPLLFGAVNCNGEFYYNSALLLSAQGDLLGKYDKLHLVPFGEYIPLKKTFPFLETVAPIGDITRGKEYTIFEIQNQKSKIKNKFSVLICFEDLFPELSRGFVRRGAEFLVNITNDAWYKDTSAAEQHFQASVLRAVENRITVIRSANTGISGFISPLGRVAGLVQGRSCKKTFIQGHLTQKIEARKAAFSFYTRYGNIFILILFVFFICDIFYGIFTRRKKK